MFVCSKIVRLSWLFGMVARWRVVKRRRYGVRCMLHGCRLCAARRYGAKIVVAGGWDGKKPLDSAFVCASTELTAATSAPGLCRIGAAT